MAHHTLTNKSRRASAIVCLIAAPMFLAGCLGGSGSSEGFSTTPNPDPTPGPTNSAPVISGSPSSAVTVGNTYSFTPTASDADGDTLTFSIENQPAWASFDTATGQISGQPTVGDLGMYDNIVIRVTDGVDTTSMSPFAVSVNSVATGSVSLSWTPPTQYTDGSSLSVAGYRIYYGTQQNVYNQQVDITNPSVSTVTIDNLTPDTYYFVATSIDSSGVESSYSNVATKVVTGS